MGGTKSQAQSLNLKVRRLGWLEDQRYAGPDVKRLNTAHLVPKYRYLHVTAHLQHPISYHELQGHRESRALP